MQTVSELSQQIASEMVSSNQKCQNEHMKKRKIWARNSLKANSTEEILLFYFCKASHYKSDAMLIAKKL